MRNSIIISLLSLILGLSSGCASYNYSNKSTGERMKLQVREDPNDLINRRVLGRPQADPEELNNSRGMFIGEALSMAATGVRYLIDLDRKKYTASYRTGLDDLYFYNRPSVKGPIDPQGIQFSGFEVVRLVEAEKGKKDTALYMSFSVDLDNPYEIINNSFFRLQLDSMNMDYSKAKIPGFRWYLPWTIMYRNYNKINLDVEIELKASWMSESGGLVTDQTIGLFTLFLRNIPLGEDDAAREQYFNNISGKKISGQCYLVPRSYGQLYDNRREFTQCWGQGNYSIAVNIKESSREDAIRRILYKHTDYLIGLGVNKISKILP